MAEPAPQVEYIGGIPFTDAGGDCARCELCREVCDVGAELRQHIAWHQERQGWQ